jgi:uncharacterized membrane protein
MRTTFAAAIALVILQHPAYSIERMECGGTEPFWDAKLSDTQVIFALPSGKRGTIYPAPRYSAARNAPFVTSVMATRGRSTLIAFAVDERLMIIADKKGGAPPGDLGAYKAYCSDGMSDRRYPFSIHLIVDGNTFTGCCSTSTSPPVRSD